MPQSSQALSAANRQRPPIYVVHPSGIWSYDPKNPDAGFTQEGEPSWFKAPKLRCKKPCNGFK